jgi:hypothetical protein
MLPLLAMVAAFAFPECPPEVPPEPETPVLDAWTGALFLDGQGPPEPPTAITVDAAWAGHLEPELRSSTTGMVRQLLGPPSIHLERLRGWDAPYGCLVLTVESGVVQTVEIALTPCMALHSRSLVFPAPVDDASSPDWAEPARAHESGEQPVLE